LAALQHVFVHEFNELLRLGGSLAEFDAGVNVFRILAEDNDVELLGMLYRAGDALVVLDRANALVEIHELAQSHVEAAYTAADRSGERSLDRYAKIDCGLHGIVGQPVLGLAIGLLASENFIPLDLAFAAVGLLHCGVKDAL